MALSTLESVCSNFDVASKVTPVTVKHCTKSSEKDERTMLDALHKNNVFKANGSHSKLPSFSRNHLSRIDRKKFETWIKGHIKKFGKLQNKELTAFQQNRQDSTVLSSRNPVEVSLSLVSEFEDDDWDEQ